MTYRELLERLSARIGQHQFPIQSAATELRGFIESGAVHYELVTQLATAIYTGNRCRRLNDPVNLEATFEALEPIRLAVLRAPRTDIDAFQLVESVCFEIATALIAAEEVPGDPAPSARGRLFRFRRRLRI